MLYLFAEMYFLLWYWINRFSTINHFIVCNCQYVTDVWMKSWQMTMLVMMVWQWWSLIYSSSFSNRLVFLRTSMTQKSQCCGYNECIVQDNLHIKPDLLAAARQCAQTAITVHSELLWLLYYVITTACRLVKLKSANCKKKLKHQKM